MDSFNRIRALAALAALVVVASPVAARGQDAGSGDFLRPSERTPCVRSEDGDLAAALVDGETRSPTFRRLVERLEQSDLIVHVLRVSGDRRPRGVTQFVADAGGYRFVRVTLTMGSMTDAAIALLGHELQHAVEVADAPSVVDASTHGALARDIGYESCRTGRCYDTRAAVRVGYRVFRELRASRSLHRRPAPVETRLARFGD